MENTILKILGWVLLVLGIGIIGWILYSSYNIFTNQTSVAQIFTLETQIKPQSSGLLGGIQDQIQDMLGQQIQGMIPRNTVTKLLNLTAWSIFSGIGILAGSQISGLGIKMTK